jgi:hypothetical protein
MLILAQLLMLPTPAGVCTCLREKSNDGVVAAKTCSCEHGCGCHKQTSTSKSKRNQSCPEPTCPAHPMVVKAASSLPTAPAPLPSAMPAKVAPEPPASAPPLYGHRATDSILLPTTHLFLIYGVLLI